MRPLHIDFAPRSWRRTVARLRPMAWLLGGLAFALCAQVALNAWGLTQQMRANEAALAHLQTQLTDRTARQSRTQPVAIPELQAAAVNRAIAQLNLPWRDVFDAFEAATPLSIALIALEPDAKKQVARGLAEASTSDAMIAYIAQLKQPSFFDAVELTKHEINEQDPNKPIRFQFEAHWREGAQ